MRYVGFTVLIYALISISSMFFVAVLLSTFYIKKKIAKMDEVKWDLYFKSMNNSAYLIRFWLVYLFSLIAISIIAYYVLLILGVEEALFLSVLTIILGIVKMIFKFKNHMNEMLEKINKIRSL